MLVSAGKRIREGRPDTSKKHDQGGKKKYRANTLFREDLRVMDVGRALHLLGGDVA